MFMYPVILTRDKKDGGFVVTFADIPETISQGDTIDEALELNEMIAQNVRAAKLARRLHTTPQEINRLTNVRHTTRIDGIAAALQALGKHLDIRVI